MATKGTVSITFEDCDKLLSILNAENADTIMLSPEEKEKRLQSIRNEFERAEAAWEREGGFEGRRGWTHAALSCYEHAKARYEWALKGYFHWEPGYGLMTEEERERNEIREEEKMQQFFREVDEWKRSTRSF
jgi:hypothetical protein